VAFLSFDTPRRDPKDIIFVNPEDGMPESFTRGKEERKSCSPPSFAELAMPGIAALAATASSSTRRFATTGC
jgi:hypothetical protein